MAKKNTSVAKSTVTRHPVTGEVTEMMLPHEDPQTSREIAENYFAEHPEYPFKSLIVCKDGERFPGSPKGANAAQNYCAANKLAVDENDPGFDIINK